MAPSPKNQGRSVIALAVLSIVGVLVVGTVVRSVVPNPNTAAASPAAARREKRAKAALSALASSG